MEKVCANCFTLTAVSLFQSAVQYHNVRESLVRPIGAPFTVGLGRPAASSFLLSSAEELGQEGLSSTFLWIEGGDGEGKEKGKRGGRKGEKGEGERR